MRRLAFSTVAAILVFMVSIAAPTPASAYSITHVSNTYSSNCLSGRICLNRQTSNSCSNLCRAFNASGGSYDYASNSTGWYSAERMYNRNSGSYRDACGYKASYATGTPGRANYGAGWTPMPFTGVGFMEALPLGARCSTYDVWD